MSQEKESRITISVPVSLRKMLKVRAIENDRSYSGEIVHCLKKGSGWFSTQAEELENGD